MQDPAPKPAPHAHGDRTSSSRAGAQAPATAPGDAAPRRPPGELMAAALKTHRMLSRGLGQNVALTPLGPDGAARGLAAFVAVYAAQQERGGNSAP